MFDPVFPLIGETKLSTFVPFTEKLFCNKFLWICTTYVSEFSVIGAIFSSVKSEVCNC